MTTGEWGGGLWLPSRRDELAQALARAAGIARPGAPIWFRVDEGEPWPVARVPAFFQVEADGGERLLAVVDWTSEGAHVLGTDGRVSLVDSGAVVRLMRQGAEARVSGGVDRVVARAKLPDERAQVVRRALVGAALGGEPAAQGWQLAPAATSLRAALRAAGLPRRLAFASLAYGAELALLVVAWWLIGARATSAGVAGTALGWLAVLAAFVAARSLASAAAGRLAVETGYVLRARLMDGLLALDTEPLRAEGIGQLLGRVMETEAVESLALGGGLMAVAGLFELTTGVVVLALGARAPAVLACLGVALAFAAVLGARFWRALARWSARRLSLTHELVERMVGHRTLVTQQPAELRHREEDGALADYEREGEALDDAGAALAVLVPRGFLLAGVAALAPALAAGFGARPAGVAIATSLGGLLFVYGALRKLTQAFPSLATAALAWRQVGPLFAGAGALAQAPAEASGPATDPTTGLATAEALVSARGLQFRYPGRARPAVDGCSFEIRRGERVLLEGPSGGGKSTLAALIAGLRAPDAGVLALDGAAQPALGLARWRERVGVVPQFHENHVVSHTLLFNLLMARAWPPRREDIVEAETLCRELDLGALLARMPSGLEQLVGEQGWQLSHGERSRLYIARALLQKLDVRVLDESFAALDPETLERVLACVLARAETLVVIAHP